MGRIIGLLAVGVCLVVVFVLFRGCGDVVDPNTLVLRVKIVGDRSVDVSNLAKEGNRELEVLTATRLPWVSMGETRFFFPLANLAYDYTREKNLESPNNEEICFNTADGTLCGNISVHMRIERQTDPKDPCFRIHQCLFAFVREQRLEAYSGRPDVFAAFMRDVFPPILRNIVGGYAQDKTSLSILQNKEGANGKMSEGLNGMFGKYGLVFTLAGFSSELRPGEIQQGAMNKAVLRDMETKVLQLRAEKIEPQLSLAAQERILGQEEAARKRNAANAYAIQVEEGALQKRRMLLAEAVGQEEAFRIEKILAFARALRAGKTKMEFIPNPAFLFQGNVPSTQRVEK